MAIFVAWDIKWVPSVWCNRLLCSHWLAGAIKSVKLNTKQTLVHPRSYYTPSKYFILYFVSALDISWQCSMMLLATGTSAATLYYRAALPPQLISNGASKESRDRHWWTLSSKYTSRIPKQNRIEQWWHRINLRNLNCNRLMSGMLSNRYCM